MQLQVERPLIVIAGLTAVGKTDLAIKIAKFLDGEVISADSRYLYRKMDIGTAKPNLEQMKEIKHHLIDVADIEENWSLAVYKMKALQAFEDITQKNKLPFLVGGTGQYIRAVIEGWHIPPKRPSQRLRRILEKIAEDKGQEEIHQQLSLIDPEAAEKIDYRNQRRTIRALEVVLTTGRKFSELRKREPIDFRYKMIGLIRPREELYERIDLRINKMIKSGFIEEVKQLLDLGYGLKNPPMSAIGYREIVLFLKNELDLEDAVKLIQKRSRQFVRRQANWFKPDEPRIKWFNMNSGIEDQIIAYILSTEGWHDE